MQYKLFFFLFLSASVAAFSQDKEQVYYSPEFKWEIRIPPGFEGMSAEDQKTRQDKGAAAIEKTYEGAQVVNNTTTLFVYKKGKFTSIEANHQPFDPADGTHP